ncbi:MAG: transglutaminase-like domain-containing protein, partial [Nitrospirota bacterium]
GREKIPVNGIAVEAFKISGDLNGVSYIMWVDEKGNELKAESPLGFTLVAEPMEEAIKFYGSSSDIIMQTAVPFDLELPDDVAYLKVKVRGVKFMELDLNSERQVINGNIVEIKQEDIGNFKPVSLPIPGMEQYLKETPFIQSGDERIIELASKIVGDEKDALSAGRLLWLWVFENIEKVPSLTVPSAVDVLKTKRGDCNEHTVLYTALARAAGLPARMDVGLVYRDGYFYYHAWPEVFTGRWIAIDPTLGQFPADATHLKLISGDIDKQVVLLKIINKISLKGIEYK